MKLPITAIILTFNEEKNIADCLNSVVENVTQVIVVDSFSKDRTKEIVSSYPGVELVEHEFINYAEQRNWAFENLQINGEFIFNIDADHRPSKELFQELRDVFESDEIKRLNGFMASRKTMFFGRWIKYGGHYPVYHAIIFRKGHGYCEHKEYDQHFVIEGSSKILKNDVEDTITSSLSEFTSRHNKWAEAEAKEAMKLLDDSKKVKANKNGNEMEKRRYQRLKYYSYPIFWRAFAFYIYRMIIKGGFRDGVQGMIFHTLQGFWFRFLVDAKIWEIQNINKNDRD